MGTITERLSAYITKNPGCLKIEAIRWASTAATRREGRFALARLLADGGARCEKDAGGKVHLFTATPAERSPDLDVDTMSAAV